MKLIFFGEILSWREPKDYLLIKKNSIKNNFHSRLYIGFFAFFCFFLPGLFSNKSLAFLIVISAFGAIFLAYISSLIYMYIPESVSLHKARVVWKGRPIEFNDIEYLEILKIKEQDKLFSVIWLKEKDESEISQMVLPSESIIKDIKIYCGTKNIQVV